jgi:hypothetical protein
MDTGGLGSSIAMPGQLIALRWRVDLEEGD